MAWREHAFSVSLTITGQNEDDTYIGSGTRVFYQVNTVDASDSLPDIGDDFYYGATSETYAGIKCTGITFSNEFVEEGESYTTCNSGAKATCTYSSNAIEDEDLPEGVPPEEAESNWQGETRTITLPGDYWVFYNGSEVGNITVYNLDKIIETPVANDIPIQTSTGTFSVNKDFNTFNSFKTWVTSTFPNYAGKLNDAAYYGFPIGTVLCNSFSKTFTQNRRGIWVHRVSVQLQWMLAPGVATDTWQKLPGDPTYIDGVESQNWFRVVRGRRSPGAGVIADNIKGLYEYASFSGLFS
jgi:hypothetical protein